MALGKFRLKRAAMALIPQDGREVAHTLPAGTIVTADPIDFDNEIVDVMWGDQKAMMFTQDLRSRSESMRGKAVGSI